MTSIERGSVTRRFLLFRTHLAFISEPILSAAASPNLHIRWCMASTHCTRWNAICPFEKAITITFRENCPIPGDTAGEYGKIYIGPKHGISGVVRPSPLFCCLPLSIGLSGDALMSIAVVGKYHLTAPPRVVSFVTKLWYKEGVSRIITTQFFG